MTFQFFQLTSSVQLIGTLRYINEVNLETDVVDVLINASGICEMSSFNEASALDMRMHLETNVIGYFNLLKYFEPLILSEETHIINLFSISAKRYFPNTAAYTAGEFAKKGMLGVIENEWKKYLIRFSNFYIGAVDTPLWDDYPEVDTSKMLSTEDFQYVLNMVLDAPNTVQFPELTFMHKDGFLD